MLRRLDEFEEGPVVHEGDHRALPAPEVQAVVPVRTEPLADAGGADLLRGKIECAFHVLVHRCLAGVRERHNGVEERSVSGLPDKLADRRHDPERVVGAGVLQSVDDVRGARRRDHGGKLHAGELLVPGLEDLWVEQVQAVPAAHLPVKKLDDPLPAL